MAARDRTLLLALVASVILAGCRAVLPLPADEAFVRPPDDAGPGILEPPEALGRYPELVQMRAGAPSPIVPRHSTIRAEVWADTAAVRIEQTFVNDSDYAFPVRYALSLPASALEACHEHYYSKAKRRTLRLRSTLDGQRSAVRHEWLEGSLGPRGDDCIEQALEQLDWRAVARERAVVEFELEFRI